MKNLITAYLTFTIGQSGNLNLKRLHKLFVIEADGTSKEFDPSPDNFEKFINQDVFFNIEPTDLVYLPALSQISRTKLLKILEIAEKEIRLLSDGTMIFAPVSIQKRRMQITPKPAPVKVIHQQNPLFW